MAPLQRSKSSIQEGQLQIQHFTHQHVLPKIYMTSEFNCDGCNTGGYGVRYRCTPCDFDLHEQCATAAHRVSANIHPHHHLVLVNRPAGDSSHVCHVCKGLTNGLCYTCEVPTCEFNVHTICTPIMVAKTGEKSLTLDPCQVQGTMATTVLGGYNGAANNNQPVLMNLQPMQSNSQPMMVNHLQPQLQPQPQMQGMQFGGYNGANTNQPMMVNNNQTHMINNHQQQQQQVKPMAGYGGYNGVNNGQPMMVNHHQGIPTTAFGGYPGGGMNSQPVMVNHHQQAQLMPTTSFNTNRQFMTNQQQQMIGIPPTAAVGGYNVVNNNQTVMISQPPPPPPPPPQQQSNGYAKVGKLAANIISTSLIGVPLFMSGR